MKKYTYSPLPMTAYRLHGVPADEVTALQETSVEVAAWNFFWLSGPDIDYVPAAGVNWWRVYRPKPGFLSTLLTDVQEDEVLFRKVLMHPYAFSAWFEREDHTIYNAYDTCGGADWVKTVLLRAEEAGDRVTKYEPPIAVSGNVLRVNFQRAA